MFLDINLNYQLQEYVVWQMIHLYEYYIENAKGCFLLHNVI